MNMSITGRQYQQGMGYWGYMMMVIAIIAFGKIGMEIVPPYIDDRALDSVIEKKLASAGSATGQQVFENIKTQLRLDSSAANLDEMIEVVSGSPGSIILKKNYDVRSNLFAHVDVVSHFEKEFRQ